MGQLGVTSVTHHLLRDWPIVKVWEKKFSSLQKWLFKNALSLTLDFPVSPLAIDKTASKNQAKTQLKHVLTGDRESGSMSTTTHLAKLAHTVLLFPEHKCPSQEKD